MTFSKVVQEKEKVKTNKILRLLEIFANKNLILATCKKCGGFKVEYSSLKALPQFQATASKKIIIRIFKRVPIKLSISIPSKVTEPQS